MDNLDELALYEFLLTNEAFKHYQAELENLESQLLQDAAFAKAPRDETIALKTAKGLRIAIDYVDKSIARIKDDLRKEREEAERKMAEAKKSLPL